MRSALVCAGRMRFVPSNLVSGSINRTRRHRDCACGRGRSLVSLKVSWFGESQWYANTDGTCTDRGLTKDAGLLARSHYSEGPATGHLDTGFSWFPCVYKQMLRWFPTFQVATTCFSCSPTDLNLLVTNFISRIHVK